MDEVILAIKSLLETSLGGTYNMYFYGQQDDVARDQLPVIEIIPINSSTGNRGTGGLRNAEYQIRIQVKTNLKSFVRSDTTVEKVSGLQDLVKKVEDLDANGNYVSTSILGVLGSNLGLNGTADINDEWEVNYEDLKTSDESWTGIATIDFVAQKLNC